MVNERPRVEPGKRVLVIGAGIAGLTVAKGLSEGGYEVTVLEARERIGGRIWTNQTFGVPVELGASFLHGGPGNPFKQRSGTMGLAMREFNYGSAILYDATQAPPPSCSTTDLVRAMSPWRSHTSALYRVVLALAAHGGWSYVSTLLAHRLGRTASPKSLGVVLDAVETGLYRKTSPPFPNSLQLAHILRVLLETGFASDVEELSFANLVLRSETKPQGWLLPKGEQLVLNGMDRIPHSLAQGSQILCGQHVRTVVYRRGAVQVTTDTQNFDAEAAVVTLPVGVLLSGVVTFDPPLPTRYLQAFAMVDMGVLNKVAMVFPRIFWPNDPALFVPVPERDALCTWFLNFACSGLPILVGFVGGRAAYEVEQQSDDMVGHRMIEQIKKIFHGAVPGPSAPPLVTRWGSDPFAYGSYSRFHAGATGQERLLLTQPLRDTLFFAGEATHPHDPSTLHGAYWSGLRTARQIAGD